MLLEAAQSVGEAHRYRDGLPLEVLGNAIGGRHIRRHEFTLHTHADCMNRPLFAHRGRQVVDDGLDKLLCY